MILTTLIVTLIMSFVVYAVLGRKFNASFLTHFALFLFVWAIIFTIGYTSLEAHII